MTELEAFIAFLSNVHYPKQARDIAKLQRVLEFCSSSKDKDGLYYLTVVAFFNAYYKALVAGLNTGYFQLQDRTFERRKHVAYPRLFSGLASTIFDNNGKLLPDFDRDNCELLLQGLAFFKRVLDPRTCERSERKALEDFVGSQERVQSFSPGVASLLKKLWGNFIGKVEHRATLGFPGPGATLDEINPYNPRYVILDTNDPDLPCELRHLYDAAFKRYYGWEDSRSYTLQPGDRPVGLYQLKHSPILRYNIVPKNSESGRLITIQNVGNTIMGATIRETMVSVWRHRGVDHQLNIHDQTMSHKTMCDNPDDVANLDIRFGSSCFSNKFNAEVCPDFMQDYLTSQMGAMLRLDDDEMIPLTTQLMGDSSSVAILTTNLYLCVCLAVWLDTYAPPDLVKRAVLGEDVFWILRGYLTRAEMGQLFEYCSSLNINIVGDDVVVPKRYLSILKWVLSSIDIQLNTQKCSTAGAVHKETCGAWILRNVDGSYRRLYPWRFPKGTTLVEKLQTATQFLMKVRNSLYIDELTLALAEVVSPLLLQESYCSHHIGSPVGQGLPKTLNPVAKPPTEEVSDTTAYYWRLGDQHTNDSTSKITKIEDINNAINAIRPTGVKKRDRVRDCYFRTRSRKWSPRNAVRPYRDPARPSYSRNKRGGYLHERERSNNRRCS